MAVSAGRVQGQGEDLRKGRTHDFSPGTMTRLPEH